MCNIQYILYIHEECGSLLVNQLGGQKSLRDALQSDQPRVGRAGSWRRPVAWLIDKGGGWIL